MTWASETICRTESELIQLIQEKGAPHPCAAPHDHLAYSAEVTLIFFGWTASRLGMTISSTPWFDFADIASGFAVSGKLKRR